MSTKPINAASAVQHVLHRLTNGLDRQRASPAKGRASQGAVGSRSPGARLERLAQMDPATQDGQSELLLAFVEDALAEHFGRPLAADPGFAKLVLSTRDAMLAGLRERGEAEGTCRLVQRGFAARR